MEKLISIIVPIHNASKYLKKCINSLIQQTYKDIEIILVDDGSTDESLEICKQYAEKNNNIKIIHKENGGVSSARNEGIKISEGRYILFIDADDYIELNACEVLSEIMRKYDVDLIRFQEYRERVGSIQEEKELSQYGVIDIDKNKDSILNMFINKQELSKVTYIAYKSSCIKNIEFDKRFKWGEDWLFVYNSLLNAKSIYITNKKLYHYYINTESATHIYSKERFLACFKSHYEIDEIIYNSIVENGYKNFEKSALNTTYSCSENLLKQMAEVLDYKEYNEVIQQIQESEYFLNYKSKLDKIKSREIEKIFKSKKVYLRGNIKGKLKKIYYKLKK